MSEQKSERTRPFSEYAKSITEIVSVHGRHQEPYIRAFEFRSDNVEQSRLGTLIGIFEIDDRAEASGYIVNFLVSVARKEYFINPKRGAIESLEASLHKVNLALAELVKHGSVTWLGKLSGVIAIADRDSLHFSVCGNAQVFLFRGGRASEISLGLASPEADAHPLKSFVEISSGRLQPGDKVVLFSESVMSLFSPEQLARETERMRADRFVQFLKTAITNELPRAAAILLDISDPVPLPTPAGDGKRQKKKRREKDSTNFFSAFTYDEQEKRRASVAQAIDEDRGAPDKERPEYTDAKTGHIYIHGDEKEAEAEERRFHSSWLLNRLSEANWILLRSGKKILIIGRIAGVRGADSVRILADRLAHIARRFHSRIESGQSRQESASPPYSTSPIRDAASPPVQFPVSPSTAPEEFKDKTRHVLTDASASISRIIRPRKAAFALVGALLLIGGGVFLLLSGTEDPEETPPSPVPSHESTPESTPAVPPGVSFSQLSATPSLFAVKIRETVFSVGTTGVENIGTKEVFTLPDGGGVARLATYMPDLSTLFILTDTKKLISFSPSNGRFSQNTLPLPAASEPTAIAAYLTYLYVLDDTGTLYRFPRSEGGFDSPKRWFQEGLSRPEGQTLSVSEFVTLSSSSPPFLERFSRGKVLTSFRFIAPDRTLNLISLTTDEENGIIYALDSSLPGILAISPDGTVLHDVAHPDFTDKKTITITKDRSLLLSGQDGVLMVVLAH